MADQDSPKCSSVNGSAHSSDCEAVVVKVLDTEDSLQGQTSVLDVDPDVVQPSQTTADWKEVAVHLITTMMGAGEFCLCELQLYLISVPLANTAGQAASWAGRRLTSCAALLPPLAGILSLPYALASLGWIAGVLILIFVTLESFYSAYLLATLHELRDGRRIQNFRALARETAGTVRHFLCALNTQ